MLLKIRERAGGTDTAEITVDHQHKNREHLQSWVVSLMATEQGKISNQAHVK